jgi:hypothetical protein
VLAPLARHFYVISVISDVVLDLPFDVLADAGRDGIRATGARVDTGGVVASAAIDKP